MVLFPSINDKHRMSIFVIGCVSVYLFLYFLNRDVARSGVYLLAIVGLYQIYRDGLKNHTREFWLKALSIFIILLIVAYYLSSVCCGGTEYYNKPYIHLLVMYPFIIMNIFLNGWIKWLLNISLMFVLVCILAYSFSDYPLNSAKYFESHYGVYLLIAPIAYAVYQGKVDPNSVFKIFIISGIIIGFAAIADYTDIARSQFWPFDEYLNHKPRIGTSINPIQFALIVATVLAVVVSGLMMMVFSFNKANYILVTFSIIFLGVTLIFSGSRGAWISIPFVCLIPFIYSPMTVKMKLVVFILLALIMVLILQIPFVQSRLGLISEEISEYRSSTEMTDSVRSVTSVGLRFELWKASWETFKNNPVLGVGPGSLRNYMQDAKIGSSGKFHKEVEIHRNSHNLYFKALSERGFLGFISVLSMLALPGIFFLMHIRKVNSADVSVFAIAGLLIVIVFALGGLTIGSLHKSELSIFYVFSIALFSGLVLSSKDSLNVSK